MVFCASVSVFLHGILALSIILSLFSQEVFGINEHTDKSESIGKKMKKGAESQETTIPQRWESEKSGKIKDESCILKDLWPLEMWDTAGNIDKDNAGKIKNRKQDVSEFRNGGMTIANKDMDCEVCVDHVIQGLKRDLNAEVEERKALKRVLDTYITDLHQLRMNLHGNKSMFAQGLTPVHFKDKDGVSFFAKLSNNREVKPLDTIVFDSVLSNQGQGYDPETGVFTAPLAGTYMFFSTILSGYNTKVETAMLANDKEVTRIYSGAHDAHGSGSNMVILDLHVNDVVRVHLLLQGGNHVHGYYSTFSGALLTGHDK